MDKQTDFQTFVAEDPQINPSRVLIKGVIFGVRVEEIEKPTILDKPVNKLAREKRWRKFCGLIFKNVEILNKKSSQSSELLKGF